MNVVHAASEEGVRNTLYVVLGLALAAGLVWGAIVHLRDLAQTIARDPVVLVIPAGGFVVTFLVAFLIGASAGISALTAAIVAVVLLLLVGS